MLDPNNRPGGPHLIVTAKTAHKVHFLDAASLAMTATLDMPGSTHEIALSLDGRTAFASVYGDGIFAKRINPDFRDAEIALAICAEMLAVLTGRAAGALRQRAGSVDQSQP